MGSRERISPLTVSDIAHLLDRAEDPELAAAQLVGSLEESIVDLRRETVAAVARQNQLRKRLFAAQETAGRVEQEASLALSQGRDLRARHVLGRQMGALVARDRLENELHEAGRASAELVATLVRMEDQAQLARRRLDDLVRQKRAGASTGSGPSAVGMRPSGRRGQAFAAYAEAVRVLGREASQMGGDGEDGGGRC